MPSLRACVVLGLGGSLCAALPSPAAAAPLVVRVAAVGDCPAAAQVAAALVRARPELRVVEGGEAPSIEVRDEANGFRVRAAGLERAWADAERRCEERARTAAVFALLALERARPPAVTDVESRADTPPREGLRAPPDVEAGAPLDRGAEAAPDRGVQSPLDRRAEATPAPTSIASPPRRPISVEIAAEGAFVFAPGGGWPIAGGAALRASARRGFIGGALGIGALGPAGIELDGAAARLVRVPIDFDLRAAIGRGRVEIAGDLGLLVDVLVARGVDLAAPRTSVGAVPGIRVAARVALRLGRLAPYAGVEGAFFPRPQPLRIDATHLVGEAPAAWIGIVAGLALSMEETAPRAP